MSRTLKQQPKNYFVAYIACKYMLTNFYSNMD